MAQSIGYGEMRQGRPGRRAKFVQVESRMSQTGAQRRRVDSVPAGNGRRAGAGHRARHPEREARAAGRRIACRLAHRRLVRGPTRLHAGSGREADRRELLRSSSVSRTRSRKADQPLPSIGGAPLAHTNGLFNALAVNALESLVDAGHDQAPILGLHARSRPVRATDAGQPGRLKRVCAICCLWQAARAADAVALRGQSDFLRAARSTHT